MPFKPHPDNPELVIYTPNEYWIPKPWQGLTAEDWENTPDTGKQGCERDAELFDWIEQTLKEKNCVDEYKTLSAGKYWLEQGWYTAKQLQDIIDTHNRMNEQLRKSMQPTKEKK